MVFGKRKQGVSLDDLVGSIHPTPAVCGFPKVAAKHFILENENYNRAFYTGYLGELNYEKLGGTVYKIPGKGTEEYTAKLRIDYSVDDKAFESKDFIIINI